MDFEGPQWVPAEPEHFEEARQWRNEDRAGLRTPMMLTEAQQRTFAESLTDRGSPHRFWARIFPFLQEGNRMHSLVGLTDIQWENGLAEMSVLIRPGSSPDAWRTAVDFVLAEAFQRMRLLTVAAEVYHCAPDRLKLWDYHWARYAKTETKTPTIVPRRKWWAGRLWDSTYFTFTAEGYRQTRQIESA